MGGPHATAAPVLTARSSRVPAGLCDVAPVPVTRLLEPDDAPVLAALLRENRAALAPWEPLRSAAWATVEVQEEVVGRALEQHRLGQLVPLAVLDEDGQLVGTLNLQSVIRGFLQSCSVGYWLAAHAQGRGLATAALREAVEIAFADLRLHRVQAETLRDNVRSQRLLERVGFVRFGEAPEFIKIAGRWQDCVLYQLLTPTPGLVQVPS